MANKYLTLYILKELDGDGWGSTMLRETVENNFYEYIATHEVNKNYFYQFIKSHEITYTKREESLCCSR